MPVGAVRCSNILVLPYFVLAERRDGQGVGVLVETVGTHASAGAGEGGGARQADNQAGRRAGAQAGRPAGGQAGRQARRLSLTLQVDKVPERTRR